MDIFILKVGCDLIFFTEQYILVRLVYKSSWLKFGIAKKCKYVENMTHEWQWYLFCYYVVFDVSYKIGNGIHFSFFLSIEIIKLRFCCWVLCLCCKTFFQTRQSSLACSLRLMGKALVIMFIITLMTELLLWLEQVCINNGKDRALDLLPHLQMLEQEKERRKSWQW